MDDVSPEDRVVIEKIAELREEHRALDDAVQAMDCNGVSDELKIARLKKRKLALRDEISRLEDQLNPDIIA
jgi:hypothetical protein